MCTEQIYYLTMPICSFLTTLGFLLTIIYLSKQIKLFREQMKNTRKWNQQIAIRDMAQSFSQNFYKHQAALRKKIPTINFSEMAQTYNNYASEDSTELDILDELLPILSGLEQLALGIKHKIYDDNIAFELYHPILITIYRWSKPFIESRRKQPEGKSAYTELQWLHEKWQPRVNAL